MCCVVGSPHSCSPRRALRCSGRDLPRVASARAPWHPGRTEVGRRPRRRTTAATSLGGARPLHPVVCVPPVPAAAACRCRAGYRRPRHALRALHRRPSCVASSSRSTGTTTLRPTTAASSSCSTCRQALPAPPPPSSPSRRDRAGPRGLLVGTGEGGCGREESEGGRAVACGGRRGAEQPDLAAEDGGRVYGARLPPPSSTLTWKGRGPWAAAELGEEAALELGGGRRGEGGTGRGGGRTGGSGGESHAGRGGRRAGGSGEEKKTMGASAAREREGKREARRERRRRSRGRESGRRRPCGRARDGAGQVTGEDEGWRRPPGDTRARGVRVRESS
ncbi:hypothetical protein BS78_05G209000 [Paspalum vaginatum]|nr:hypothetical protein BS78_05G209000 [Paspalum vaginatum]